ncbi:hypothetical protein E1200_14135 [Actinomadura sp. GC306]|uniref:hypothetical protein n=1 Tax=Actinomadura sp. GC306 TaxID=2530367 RepID=UPI0010503564|nr:hypothetical protein [Actinomadura sp. GC306]TDC67685.1 hypothetical protein E1200_14135 [Actinomadura sp. GC306]
MITVVAAAGVLVGCSDGSTPAATEARQKTWKVPEAPDAGIRDELQSLFEGADTRFAAEEELVHRCMTAKGFHYVKLASPSSDVHPTMSRDEYGITVAAAKRDGYGSRERLSRAADHPDPSGLRQMTDQQRKSWGEAFYGPDSVERIKVELPDGSRIETSPQGCLSEARKKIFGSLEQTLKSSYLAANIPIIARKKAAADPEMVALNKVWAQCMTSAGHPGLANPESARSKAAGAYKTMDQSAAFKLEVEMAVSDAECEREQGYAAKRRELEGRYYTAAMRVFGAEITAIRKHNQESLVRARNLLSVS